MSAGIRQATLRGLKWGTALQVGQSAIGIVVTVALARLLDRSDFGLAALTISLLAVLSTLVELGFGAAVVQKRSLDDADIATAFLSNLGIGAAMAIAVCASAPLVASFWGSDALKHVLMASSPLLIFRAAASVPTALYERELQLRPLTNITIAGTLAGSGLKVLLAWAGLGVWSLVIGELATQLAIAVQLCLRFRERIFGVSFSGASFSSLFRYGRSVAVANLLTSLSAHVDVLVIGKLVSASLLGTYTVALTIATALANAFSALIRRIAFPAFSRVQDDPARLRNGYLDALRYSSLLILGPTIGLGLVAHDLVIALLSEKWRASIPAVQILVVYAAMNALGGPLWAQVLKAQGKVDLLLLMTVVRVLALPAAILAGAQWGLIGICTGIATYAVIFRFVYQAVVNRHLGIRMRDFFGAIAPALWASAAMSASVLPVSGVLRPLAPGPFALLVAKSLVGAAVYIAVLVVFQKSLTMSLWSAVVSGHLRRPGHG